MTDRAPSPRGVAQRVSDIDSRFQAILDQRGNERLRGLWPGWKARLDDIAVGCMKRPEVAISMIGDSGSGKSTLLNAIVGARILPVSNMRACTAAVSEISYLEGKYRVEVDFVSREDWEQEIERLRADIQAAFDSDEPDDSAAAIPRAARDRLWTVYRPLEDADSAQFDIFNLVEPPEIKEALESGTHVDELTSLDDLRNTVAQYLDSKHRYWPIVKTVRIYGPFSALRGGIKLIDLPGLNDPNEAREEVTRNHLKSCRFVWIVFNIKRALTRNTTNLMLTDDFVRQVVMDGRTDSLTFVGTASDDVDLDTGIDEFGLDFDASEMEVVRARNHEVRKVIRQQLDEMPVRLAAMTGERQDETRKLAEKLQNSKCFTLSAREFMRLRKLSRTRSAGFQHLDETEIPQLKRHMDVISANFGVEAQSTAYHRQLDLLLSEVRQELESQQMALDYRLEFDEKKRKEVRAAAEGARDFLDDRLSDIHERLAQDLEGAQSLLAERLRAAVERANYELDGLVNRWARMHHGTIGAVCRRGGCYTGVSGRSDFPADLSRPILDGIAFAWSDFFGEKLGQVLDRWTERLNRIADEYRRRLIDALGSRAGMSAELCQDLDRVLGTTEKLLDELLAQTKNEMATKIETVRRTLYEKIPEQIRVNMAPAFTKAAAERGAGMKGRMIDILSQHSKDVASIMFDDARRAILDGVRGLNDWIGRKYGDMTESVRRHASLAADNILVTEVALTSEAVRQEHEMLDGMSDVVAELIGEPAA